jgi:glycosyltransferase involved in cell wall biosynthesis
MECTTQSMRVLVVTAMYPRADAPYLGTFVRDQVHSLRRLGVDIDVLELGIGRGVLKYARGCWRVFIATLRNRYDIVHAHYGLAGLVARCQLRSRVVVTFHGSDVNRPDQRRYSRLAAILADEVIVVSRLLGQLIDRPAAPVIPCGVDLSLFRSAPRIEARRALGLQTEATIILFPGSPSRRVKRFDRLREALALIPEPIVVLTLEGVPHHDVPLYLNAVDCVVLTSDTEGSPVAVREALACNTPVVSVDVGDVREWLADVSPGRVVGHSPPELAEAIAAVLRSKARSNGRERVRATDEGLIARRVLALYKRALGNGRSGCVRLCL